jgi:1,4-alpha-glucan branching enzyme
MRPDLLARRDTRFVLWRPACVSPEPSLLIGPVPNAPVDPIPELRQIALRRDAGHAELWEVEAAACGLEDGGVYLYWFKVRSSSPYRAGSPVLYCTDPFATTVDRRFPAPVPDEAGGAASGHPAGIVKYRGGRLLPCDPRGEEADFGQDTPLAALAANGQLVIYELPTRWVRPGADGAGAVGRGTFADALALVDPAALPPHFEGIEGLAAGRALLLELGVNALELLPAADSEDDLNWGYGTAHFLAADFQLGGGAPDRAPTATSDLARLVLGCHRRGLRFFADMVTAFARNDPYRDVNYLDFHVRWRPRDDPERDPEQGERDGFGGDLLKYNYRVEGYQPWNGGRGALVPGREYMKLQMAHWLEHYRLDGLRLDSVNNTGSYDFLQEFKDAARGAWRTLPRARDVDAARLEERFLVVGEELSVPIALVAQQRLDGLWNEGFKQRARRVVLGRTVPGDASFEASVRRMIDCRQLGFADGAQAVNYLTSHDVGGFGNERLCNWLANNGVGDPAALERRVELAFACLLTAVGIPMILAGEEFADQHDLDIGQEHGSAKQVDPVNYGRLAEPWRRRVFDYVARLVRFRTRCEALAVNDTEFIHADCAEGRRVLAWRRGPPESPVVVVANFSDWGTPEAGRPEAEYVVAGFPRVAGRHWREVTQDRWVPDAWAGREPLYPWEAKVYVAE